MNTSDGIFRQLKGNEIPFEVGEIVKLKEHDFKIMGINTELHEMRIQSMKYRRDVRLLEVLEEVEINKRETEFDKDIG